MAIVLEGDGTITGVTTFTTPLDDISFDSINVTGIVTASTFQAGTGVSISSPRSQTLALFTNNVEAFHIDDAGRVGIGTTNANKAADTNNTSIVNAGIITANTLYDNYIKHPSDTFTITTNSNERLRIINDGRVLINHTSSKSTGGTSTYLQVHGTTSGTSSASLIRNSSDNAGPFLALAKSRGTSNGSNTVVQDGDSLGSIRFCGADGSDTQSWGAQIKAQVDGTPGSDDMPGALVFATTADGANSATERVRITRQGKVGIGTIASEGVQLQVYHATTNEVARFISGDGTVALSFQDSATTSNRPTIGGKTDDFFISVGGTEKVRVDSTGHVGINTSTLGSTGLYVINDTSIVARFARGSGSGEWAKVDIMAGTGTGNSTITFSDPIASERGLIEYEHNDDSFRFGVAGTANRMMIDSSGRLLVGATAAMTTGSSDHRDTIQATDAAGAQLLLARNDTGVSATNRMGEIAALGNDTNSNGFKVGASIRFEADDAWSEDDFPTAILFKTCANNGATLTERVRINNAGKLSVGTAAVADQTLISNGGLDVSARGDSGKCSLCVGADSSGNNSEARANNQQKDCRIGMPHYENAEEPVGLINAFSGSTANTVYIGGGTSYLNAATKVSLYTAANQTTVTGTEVLRCNANQDVVAVSGDLLFETAGKGVVLGATSNVGNSNTLDDYEEGTFTPVYWDTNGPAVSATYDQQHGDYVKVGRLVTAWIRLRTDSVSGTSASNNLRISGLPFAHASNSNTGGGVACFTATWTADNAPQVGYVSSNNSYFTLYNRADSNEDVVTMKTDALSNTTNDNDSRWTISYFTAT